MTGSGKCLCGAVKITASNVSDKLGACHCSMCRKWTGSPWFAVDCGTEITFEGESFITSYASSDWADRAFCSKCGTHLFYKLKLKDKPQFIVSVGMMDNINTYNFDHQIFIDEKPDYYNFANQTHNMTGAEVFAKFA